MMYLIHGGNAYGAEQELARIVRDAGVVPERIDASTLDVNGLADIVRGNSLFATKRVVVLRELSRDSSELWARLGEWAVELGDDTTLVLLETKPDRRTKGYKSIAKAAELISVEPLTQRQSGLAEEWLRKLARDRGVGLSPHQVKRMVQRATLPGERAGQATIDQMLLYQALKALDGDTQVSDEAIDAVLAPVASDVLFSVLEFAVERDRAALEAAFLDLRLSQDAFMVFPVIASQWSQLVGVAYADGPAATIAAELEIHPFVVQKLQPLTRQITRAQLGVFTQLLADLDAKMKVSQIGPWEAIERFLRGVAERP